jgi:hypothetical protein
VSTAVIFAAAAAITAGSLPLIRHRRKRKALYASLAARRAELVDRFPPTIAPGNDPAVLQAGFEAERLQQVTDFLDPAELALLRGEVLRAHGLAERSFIPGHKKGGTLSYEALHGAAPRCLALYHSAALRRWLSTVVGTEVRPTADHDQSSCSVLYYDRPGDQIGWHIDHNFYRGRHFTVLLSLRNRGTDGSGLSAGRLQRRRDGLIREVPTPGNALVVFEGARVLHRATAVVDGEQRIMLSMTFATDPRVDPWKEAARRIKDTAYFGPRALVD